MSFHMQSCINIQQLLLQSGVSIKVSGVSITVSGVSIMVSGVSITVSGVSITVGCSKMHCLLHVFPMLYSTQGCNVTQGFCSKWLHIER